MLSACLSSPKGVGGLALRVSFGLSLLLLGLNHYMTFTAFQGMVTSDLGALTVVGMLWSYVLPALMIIGGALFVIGMFPEVASWSAGLALGSLPVGLLLKTVAGAVALPDVMPMAINGLIWLLVYYFALKSWCCGCCSSANGEI